MLLYANVSSERARKGQGGNNYIEIELLAYDRKKPKGYLLLLAHPDNEWEIRWQKDRNEDWTVLEQGHD